MLHDQRRNGQHYVGPEAAQQLRQRIRCLPLVHDSTQRVVLRERLPEVDGAELEAGRIPVCPLEPPLSADERTAVEVEDFMAALCQNARKLCRKRMTEVVVNDDAHATPRRNALLSGGVRDRGRP